MIYSRTHNNTKASPTAVDDERETPFVKLSQMEKVLFRAIPFVEKLPEHRLMFAVLIQALSDIREAPGGEQADAVRFFGDGRSDFYCEFLKLDPDFVREIVEKYWLRTTVKAWISHYTRTRIQGEVAA